MDTALKEIISSPKLLFYFKQIKLIVDEEQKKRKYFYDVVTEFQKAEFINGEIIMHSHAKIEHLTVSSNLITLLKVFVNKHDLGYVAVENALISLTRNDYEPDICFFANEKAKRFKKGQMKFPAPDFICEIISPSSEKNDRVIKFEDYAAHGVSEYWLIEPEKQIAEQYILEGEDYKLIRKYGLNSIIESVAIKGFSIPIEALFDLKINLEVLKGFL